MKKLLALAILGMMSAPAGAADLGAQGGYKDDLSNVVGPCAGVSWTGLRVGGFIGVGSTGIGSGDGVKSGVDEGGSWHDSINVSGGYQLSTIGQLEFGYDHQFKNSPLVIGVFGNLGFGSGTSRLTYSGDVRVGLAWGNALFYGFGGWEKAHVVHDISDIRTGASVASMKADPDGFVYGLGVDVALGRGWYAGVRAERVDYGNLTAKGSSGGVDYRVNVSGTDERGLLTVGYKF